MDKPIKGTMDYQGLLQRAPGHDDGVMNFFREQLPYVWRDAYLEMTLHPVNIVCFQYGSFEYIFDDYASLEITGAVPYSSEAEARLIAAFGCSNPKNAVRDDYLSHV